MELRCLLRSCTQHCRTCSTAALKHTAGNLALSLEWRDVAAHRSSDEKVHGGVRALVAVPLRLQALDRFQHLCNRKGDRESGCLPGGGSAPEPTRHFLKKSPRYLYPRSACVEHERSMSASACEMRSKWHVRCCGVPLSQGLTLSEFAFLYGLEKKKTVSPTCPMRSLQTFEALSSVLLAIPESSTFERMLLCPDNSETSTLVVA